MKTLTRFLEKSPAARRSRQAFTLVELMIAMSIAGLALGALIALQLFGLQQNQLVESKLGASDQARNLLQKMGWEIRSAKYFEIGNTVGTNNGFTEVPNGQQLKGTALRIFPTTATNNYIQYYFNTNKRALLRLRSGTIGAKVVAEDLTNNMAFQVENYRGVVQTNADDSRIWRNCIRVILEFAQYQYPLTTVGPGALYDYYKMEFKVAPHCPSLP
jgi:prepilin-type N-terminal cleavage/methylation domain-containing protein